jgi:hypothetical protein
VFLVERGEEVLDLLPEEPGGLLVRAAAGRHNLPPCATHNPSITQIYPNVDLFTILTPKQNVAIKKMDLS